MSYQQLVICLDAKDANTLSDIFFDLDVLSVSIEDLNAGTKLEKPIFDEPNATADHTQNCWESSRVTVLTTADTDINKLANTAATIFGKKFTYAIEIVADEDWVRKTQSQFSPIQITKSLYIVPSWHKTPDDNAVTITLDPGLAFGTGSHPTTHMCLKWLSDNVNTATNTVLDYGCGSGILAITAKKLGATDVYGTDIDPQAIESSTNNALQNNVKIKFSLPESLPKINFDLVIANILSNPLRILAPVLSHLTKNTLILSGILEEQALELSNIYKRWFKVVIAATMDGWVLLECSSKRNT